MGIEDKTMKQIGDNIKHARDKKGLTQADVAKKSGTNTNYYAKVERGVATPSLKLFLKIITALDARSSDILPR